MEKDIFSGCRNSDDDDNEDDANYGNEKDDVRMVAMMIMMVRMVVIVMMVVKDSGFNILLSCGTVSFIHSSFLRALSPLTSSDMCVGTEWTGTSWRRSRHLLSGTGGPSLGKRGEGWAKVWELTLPVLCPEQVLSLLSA